MAESDLELARTAMESDLKLLEGLLELKPNDRDLLMKAVQGYTGYALIFLEDKDPKRAAEMYNRARNYGSRILGKRNIGFFQLHKEEVFIVGAPRFRDFQSLLSSLKEEDLPAVYWTSSAWFSAINLNKSPKDLVEIPFAKGLMQWVLDRDPHFYYSGPLWFFGTYYASIPPMFGGDIEKSKEYFDRAIKKDGNRFLYGKILYAKYFATQTLDRDLYIKTLKDFEDPFRDYIYRDGGELTLINRFARQKATELLEQTDELF